MTNVPDVANQVFTEVRDITLAEVPATRVSSTEEDRPPSFPFTSVVEKSNTTYGRSSDSRNPENHRYLMYEVNNYSSKASGKDAEVKKLAFAQRAYFLSIGFRCSFFQPDRKSVV